VLQAAEEVVGHIIICYIVIKITSPPSDSWGALTNPTALPPYRLLGSISSHRSSARTGAAA
jgi:hypothetical protein